MKVRKLTRGTVILVMDKITRQGSFLASVIVLFREYFDDQRHPYTVKWDYVKIKCIKKQLFIFGMILRNTAITIYYFCCEIDVSVYQDLFQWVCDSNLFYRKTQTMVLEKASSSPFKVFPKGLFPSYLEHQSESWSMVNKCVE